MTIIRVLNGTLADLIARSSMMENNETYAGSGDFGGLFRTGGAAIQSITAA